MFNFLKKDYIRFHIPLLFVFEKSKKEDNTNYRLQFKFNAKPKLKG